ncbi:MAG: transglutaminase family protein [Cyanobacteria bacterium J06621_11]
MNHYRITHKTHYQYTAPVSIKPQIIRLCPRSDGAQWSTSFDLTLSPKSTQLTYFLDDQGNTCAQATFEQPISEWQVIAISEVKTTRSNPFDYLSEPWAVKLPIDYPNSLSTSLTPYLKARSGDVIAHTVTDFAQSLYHEVSGNIGYFLTQLTHRIPTLCEYQQRIEGDPYLPGITLKKRSGTCRDYAVLFVAICRAVGIAARFVSGYQEGDLKTTTHDLHAWAEVYIPGGGWRGFDPTLGLAVGQTHVAIAAAAHHSQAAPISGNIQAQQPTAQAVKTHLKSDITIERLTTVDKLNSES